jgi:dihydrodipicolinate synthase/N-acetylneuraminate lyase
MNRVLGVVPASLTCFDGTGDVDYITTGKHVNWLIESGVHGVIATGTCGEFSTLEIDERMKLIDAYVRFVNGRVPLFVGVMHTSTRTAVSLTKYAERAGAAGVMSVAPYYSALPERELLGYFRDIAEAASIPLIVYDNPRAAGVALSLNGLVGLACEGTAQIIKDSSGDPTRLDDLRQLVPDTTSLMYGNDFGGLEAVLAGADGWVTGVGNFMPRHTVRLWQTAQSGDVAGSRECWRAMLPLINISYRRSVYALTDTRPDFVQVFKAALSHLEFPAGECRRPLLDLPESEVVALHRLMDEATLTRETA